MQSRNVPGRGSSKPDRERQGTFSLKGNANSQDSWYPMKHQRWGEWKKIFFLGFAANTVSPWHQLLWFKADIHSALAELWTLRGSPRASSPFSNGNVWTGTVNSESPQKLIPKTAKIERLSIHLKLLKDEFLTCGSYSSFFFFSKISCFSSSVSYSSIF